MFARAVGTWGRHFLSFFGAEAGKPSFFGRYTFHYHARAIALEGAFGGVFLLNDVVARKAFGASDFWVMLIVMIPGVSLLFSVYFSTLIPRARKRAFFLWSGVAGRLVLVLAAWAWGAPSFALLIAISSMMFPVLIPTQNAVFQANYRPEERGRYFGAGTAIAALATMAASLGAGMLLDADERAYRFIYPAAGVVGFLACWYFYRIRWRRDFDDGVGEPALQSKSGLPFSFSALWVPYHRAVQILRKHRAFAAYETSYFVYGFGFMITATLMPFYLVDDIGVSYEQAAHMKGIIFFALVVGTSAAFGRLCDAKGPLHVSRIAFSALALFPLALYFSQDVVSVYVAFVLFGIAMAAVNIGWVLGPIHFSKESDSTAMMGVHVTLTGVRAVIAHPLAIVLKNSLGSTRAALLVATALFAAAALMMWRLERREA